MSMYYIDKAIKSLILFSR